MECGLISKKMTNVAKHDDLDYDHFFKVVIVGDSAVGKSCLLHRFVDNKFTESYISTIGVDFRFKKINTDGYNIKLQIWDTAGQEKFQSISSAYYRNANGIVIVYDLTNQSSFDHINTWIKRVHEHLDENVVKIIIGNKNDLTNERVITSEQIESKINKIKLPFYEASAKESTHVASIFHDFVRKMITQIEKENKLKELQKNNNSNIKKEKSSIKLDTTFQNISEKSKVCCAGNIFSQKSINNDGNRDSKQNENTVLP